jgi:NAD(P)-dependent dehydrogenase (short-subunit alcohol dehydrogenase family)
MFVFRIIVQIISVLIRESGNVNINGPYLITRVCIPLLRKGELKTIVNTASVGAWKISPGLSNYQTSKLALVRLTDFIAAEHADDGISAISIHPGNIATDMLGDINRLPEEVRVAFTDTAALCADGLVYLTKERREWLSGRYVNMTWDMPELVSKAKQKQIVDGDLLKIRLAVP